MSDPGARLLPPGRVQVALQWRALISGEVTREEAHAWAVPWVEGDGALLDVEDPLVTTALQHLHGFDLRRDPGHPGVLWHGTPGEGEWCHSHGDIADGFARWQENCALYDADPQGWQQRVQAQARASVRAEEARRTPE